MTPMKPLTQGTPRSGTIEERKSYDKAFVLACRYSRGWDLVEEMVAANCWPLGKNRPTMTIEMVNLPVFGEGVGVPFSQFSFQPKEGRSTEKGHEVYRGGGSRDTR